MREGQHGATFTWLLRGFLMANWLVSNSDGQTQPFVVTTPLAVLGAMAPS